MTIAVAVRIGSAVIFAADSKVTTSGIIGLDEKGDPRWVEQTYDNATKIVHDPSQTVMAMVAGYANIGQESAMDFIMATDRSVMGSHEDQESVLSAVVDSMVEQKRKFWQNTKVSEDEWPGPTIWMAAPSSTGKIPRIWEVDLRGAGSKISEILQDPGIRLEGSYNEAFGLLYGYEWTVLMGLMKELGIDKDKFGEAMRNLKVLRPVDKLSLSSMPLQDAIDLAVFLATVQVQMDRFLPGTPACGGPIDVMVLRTVPERAILCFPGKKLHHPINQRSD